MSHVILITMETLCGAEPNEGDTLLFYDGVRSGPLEAVACRNCRAQLAHILDCPGCSRRVQVQTRAITDKARQVLPNNFTPSQMESVVRKYAGTYLLDEVHAKDQRLAELAARLVKRMKAGGVKIDTDYHAFLDKYAVQPRKTQTSESDNDPNNRKEDREMSDRAAEKKKTETVVDVDVKRFGEAIVVPEGLDLRDAIGALTRKANEEEQDVQISHDFNMTPPEGAIAFLRTLTDMFGFVSPKETPGFFGPTPPTFLSIETAPGVTESVPWGRMSIPGVTGWLSPAINWINGAPQFRIAGVVRGRNKALIQKVADNMRKRTDSLYRGKAIFASFPEAVEGVSIDDFFPKFMDLPNITEEDLVFSDDIQDLVKTALFTPIEYSKECREQGISLKRGILLEGPYGTGKTLTATVTARKCVENGWTFIYLRNVKDLPRAINFAKSYAPAAIFAEDIDQVLNDPDRRDEEVNSILNSIDGIDSKGIEILTVLTTNNVDKITTAMLRPGRLDTVVPVRAPDAKAAIRLVKLFAGEQLADDQDFTNVGESLAGCIPAMIQEVVKRSKLGAVRRAAGGGVLEITAHDVQVAALSMIAHMRLLEPKIADTRSDRERAAEVMGDKVAKALTDAFGGGNAAPKTPNGKGAHTPATA